MKRRWCVATGLIALCYGCTLFVGLNLLDSEQYSEDSWMSGGSLIWSGGYPRAIKVPICSDHTQSSQVHSRCRDLNINNKLSVLVIGALSFLGSRLAAHLAGSGVGVHAVAHNSDLTVDGLVWYRKEQLEKSGVQVETLNFSNATQVNQLITKHPPAHLLYIPPAIENSDVYFPNNKVLSKHLEEFVILLETLKTISPCTRILLASLSRPPETTSHDSHMTVLGAWMESFELTLSTYHNLYGIPITILRTGGVYGPWSESALKIHSKLKHSSPVSQQWCWYIADIVRAFHKTLQLKTDCEVLDLGHCSVMNSCDQFRTSVTQEYQYSQDLLNVIKTEPLESGVRKSVLWAKSFLQQQQEPTGEHVVFTSYFTTVEDSQRNRKAAPNHFQYMSGWFLSVRELGLKAVVFHDGLDPPFMQRLIQLYSGVSFHYVPSLQNRSTNDARFYAYLNYLYSHTEINRVLLTDISDVWFQMNPFNLMTQLGDWLYIGTDIDIFPSMETMPWIHQRLQRCFGNHSVREGDLRSLMGLDTVYNAGVIGGTRHVMLAALSQIVGYLNTTPPQLNCNMPAVNYAVHKHFNDMVFTGFPLTSRFLRRQASPKGVYIVHK